MSLRNYRIVFTSPGGVIFDASSRVDIGGMGNITSSPESDLSILTHGDMSLNLDNADGEVERFLESALVTDIYTVVLERQRPGTGEWDRMFGGVLDLPHSVYYDDKAKTAHIQCYSYTKALERTKATTIKRTLVTKTASINLDTSTLVFLAGEASDLEIGDVINLNNGQRTLDLTVVKLIDSGTVLVDQPATATFTSARAEVLTPFYHDKSPDALLTLIAAAVGVPFDNRDLGSPLATFPVATPFTVANMNIGGQPHSVKGGTTVEARFPSGPFGLSSYTTTSPTVPWSVGSVPSAFQLDWTPYSATVPGTVQTTAGMSNANTPDIGQSAAADHAAGYVYEIRSDVGGGTFPVRLYRSLNGAAAGDVGSAASIHNGNEIPSSWLEVSPAVGRVFVSFWNGSINREFRYWPTATGPFVTISTAISGSLRTIRYAGASDVLIMVDNVTNDIILWNASSLVILRTIPWFNTTDNIITWSMRTWGAGANPSGKAWFTFLFERDSQTWMAIYDANGSYNDWYLVSIYRISSTLSIRFGQTIPAKPLSFQSVLTTSTGEELAFGFGGGEWFILSTRFAGVIRYADFKDSSCAKAARDIAVVLDCIVNFDNFNIMTILNRRALASSDIQKELGVPLASMRRPAPELYRSSVEVTGHYSAGGAAISEIQSVPGFEADSARRVKVDSDLVTSPGMALACAITTLQFVSQITEQREVTVEDDGTPLAIFDRVSMAGKNWLIYKLDTDLEQETHDLTLLELKP